MPTDESRYVGGLQPTGMSKMPFGGRCQFDEKTRKIEKRLVRTHLRISQMIVAQQTQQSQDASQARKILRRRNSRPLDPATIQELQDTVDIVPSASSLHQQKWSFARAKLLYGPVDQNQYQHEHERKTLWRDLDPSQRTAAKDVYRAYTILEAALQKMSLRHHMNECVQLLFRYAQHQDGFRLKGVVRRKSNKASPPPPEETSFRDLQKTQQIIAICGAAVFVISKKHQQGYGLTDTCAFFHEHHVNFTLRPKHVSKAVAEFKSMALLSTTDSNNNTTPPSPSFESARLVPTLGSALGLPAAAVGAVHVLALNCDQDQFRDGLGSGTKPSTVCAAVAWLVCRAGGIMQRLAKQAVADYENTIDSGSGTTVGQPKRKSSGSTCGSSTSSKKRRREHQHETTTDPPAPDQIPSDTVIKQEDDEQFVSPPVVSHDDFDALSDAPLTNITNEQHEVFQGWFSWCNQSDWSRDLDQIQTASGHGGPSKATILDYYKAYLHPRRTALLQKVQEYLKNSQEADVCYLVNITSAAPLMLLGQLG